MRAGQARPIYKALANHVIGCATLANVECAPQEAAGVLHDLAIGRADAVAPVMALAQSLELLVIEFHVHLAPPRAMHRARCLYSTPRQAGWSS